MKQQSKKTIDEIVEKMSVDELRDYVRLNEFLKSSGFYLSIQKKGMVNVYSLHIFTGSTRKEKIKGWLKLLVSIINQP